MLACIKGGIGRDYLEFIYVAMPADGNSLAHGSAKNYQTADEAHAALMVKFPKAKIVDAAIISSECQRRNLLRFK